MQIGLYGFENMRLPKVFPFLAVTVVICIGEAKPTSK